MPDEGVVHASSNSDHSNPSLPPLKLAKLEARMAGKPTSATAWQAAQSLSFMPAQTATQADSNGDDDDDDDDGGVEFLIRPNPQKRKICVEDDGNTIVHAENFGDVQIEQKLVNRDETSRKKGRGKGRGSGGSRGHFSKVNDPRRLSTSSSILEVQNGHSEMENEVHTVSGAATAEYPSAVQDETQLLKVKAVSLEEELFRVRQEFTECQHSNHQLEKELKDLREQEQQKEQKRLKVLSELLIAVAKSERREARIQIRHDSLRLGNLSIVRAGTVISETWEDGQAFKDIQSQVKCLMEQRETIEKYRKSLKKGKAERIEGIDGDSGALEEELLLQDEICRSRLFAVKREEESLLRDRERYELERARHIREMKRIRDEDGSRFNHFPILNRRFSLLNLLGKGGFSEVYKAYDLLENRYVACKLHSLNPQWSEEKKQSYIRHAIREYNIHKSLVHPHIVRLWETFEIDHNTFCTVLEYCSGKDLDAVLKTTPILPEREARCIMVQIFSGLVYMNSRTQRIIHYDLKPGNVLFDHMGVAKMTDFGLSKILEEEVGSHGMELTSQGAGTYWYLPPECFDIGKTPYISSKVDVWSAGVLFYQMLFGKRPFGHEQTQERILREDTIVKAHRVEFPSKPSVSSEGKEFIRRCLTYNQAERPDVLAIAQDPYLSYMKRRP